MKQAYPAERKEPANREDALGPRLQLILQQSIAPWKREAMGEEEAQIAEIRRRPVRNRFDAVEAKRRLGIKPAKRGKGGKPAAKHTPV